MPSTANSMARLQRKWTVAEDHKLREEVEAQMIEGEVKDWCRIATKLSGRTNKDCRKRWYNSVLGGLKKGQWSKGEDARLARGVQQHGQRWTLVATVVGSRSADQCAKRWQQSLDPDLDRSEWRDAEDEVLIDAVHRLGRHWKDIQSYHFQGRSKNCIKNRYTVLIRRYQNQGITLPRPSSKPEPSIGSYSPNDDDDVSYSPLSVFDDVLSTDTQVSKPEPIHSWPTESEAFSTWSTDAFSTINSTPGYSQIHQPLASGSHSPHWQWAQAAIPHPALMHAAPSNPYSHIPDHSDFPSTNVYGIAPLLSPNTTHYNGTSHMRALTSSPRPSASTAPPSQSTACYLNLAMQHQHQ